MHKVHVALVLALSLLSGALAHAEDAVVPNEFEQQQAVDACDAYGTGFAKLPGTDTCVRVSGHVRVEKRYSNRSDGFGSQTTLDFETHSD
jgi:hypothetical protein